MICVFINNKCVRMCVCVFVFVHVMMWREFSMFPIIASTNFNNLPITFGILYMYIHMYQLKTCTSDFETFRFPEYVKRAGSFIFYSRLHRVYMIIYVSAKKYEMKLHVPGLQGIMQNTCDYFYFLSFFIILIIFSESIYIFIYWNWYMNTERYLSLLTTASCI